MGGVIHPSYHMLLWCAQLQHFTVPFSQNSQQLQHIPHLVLELLTTLQMKMEPRYLKQYSYQATGCH